MVSTVMIIVSFILGAITATYCLKLGMEWQVSLVPKEGLPLIIPNKPPPKAEEEEPQEDTQPKLMKHWFAGGEKD